MSGPTREKLEIGTLVRVIDGWLSDAEGAEENREPEIDCYSVAQP